MRIRWPRSLIARILLAEVVTFALAAILLLSFTQSALRGAVARYQSDIFVAQADAVASGLRPGPDGRWRVELSPSLSPIFQTHYDGRAYRVVDTQGVVVARSAFAPTEPAPAAPRGDRPSVFSTGHLAGVSLPVDTDGQRLWVIVTQEQDRPGAILDDVVAAFMRALAVIAPLILLLPIVNGLIIRRLVGAVRRVSERAAEIDADRLSDRLPEAGLPSEVIPLVHAVNALVDRLEVGFRRQAEFSSNIAHELRTPLTTLSLKLNLVEDTGLRAQLAAQVERLSHVLSQLRDLAALETLDKQNFEAVDLKALAISVVGEMAPSVVARHHMIEVSGPSSAPVLAEPALVGLALRNLIENAVRHTPDGVRIRVSVDVDGSISVVDDGPGIASEKIGEVVRRFWRADHGRTDSAGIGLSIVQRIMDVHGGVLTVQNRKPRGASFSLRFLGERIARAD
ncbi:ATP-binding protein [uncultured Caulobacter sp.]|uniref:sensor histidine kinase n=1 Tax=uncultured Caulobacter sp. TaxID=158749 RepID=UPI0026032690|nr:ATP-binding protein [uncultured Caulobacter sp.]